MKLEKLLAKVCGEFNESYDAVKSGSRLTNLVRVRRVFVHLVRYFDEGISYREIGEVLSDRDYSSMIHLHGTNLVGVELDVFVKLAAGKKTHVPFSLISAYQTSHIYLSK